MDKCPKCHRFTIAYDSYRKDHMCTVDDCSCKIIDKETYSYLKTNPITSTVDEVKIHNGQEIGIIKSYKI